MHLQAAPDAVVLVATLLSRQPGDGPTHSSSPAASVATQPPSSSDNGSGAGGSAGVLGSRQEPAGTGDAPAASQEDQQQQQQQPQQRRPDPDAGVLVGTVEMSFTDTTRTRFLTLNPPTVGKQIDQL